MLLHKLKIGNVELENNILLAPMAGITDSSFRKITKECGPGLVFTEMVSTKALFYGDKKTLKLLNTEGEKRPIAVQLFGSDPSIMGNIAKQMGEKFEIIDINMGCPAPKIVKNGDGSRLLLNLDLIGDIVREVVKNASVPVTVKIRKGWDQNNIVAIEAAKIIEAAGASAITIHGRTKDQYYSGKVDLEIIKEVKQAVKMPVIGNGDIVSAKTAQEMLEYTNVDGIMIGRAALGNPWIFEEIIDYLGTKKEPETISNDKKLETIIRHIDLSVEEKGEEVAIKEMRKLISWYIKNLKDATKIREKVNKITKKQEMIDCLKEYFNLI